MARSSNAALPLLWIATSVKARDHHEGANFDAEEEAVREFTQTRAPNISKNNWKLVGILLQTEDSSFNFFAKTHPKARTPASYQF